MTKIGLFMEKNKTKYQGREGRDDLGDQQGFSLGGFPGTSCCKAFYTVLLKTSGQFRTF